MAVSDWILMMITATGFVFWLACLWKVEDWINETEDDWLAGKVNDGQSDRKDI